MMPKRHALSAALAASLAATTLAPQAAPRDKTARPHIEPQMALRPVAADGSAYELLIYGDIGDSWWGESVTAQSVAEQLNALDKSVSTINVRINSYGGSVADGLAIYNALKRHPATKAVTIDGVAMSSASLIAMAGDTVSMPPTSILMIHAPWGGCMGNAKEMRQYADVLDTFSEAMADAYVRKSGKSREDILSLLQDGDDHYYTGEEAVAEGFADAVSSDDAGNDEPDENARAFAAQLLERISARGAPARYAGMVVTAALRGAPRKAPAAPAARTATLAVAVDASAVREAVADALAELNPPPASGAQHLPAAAGTSNSEENAMSQIDPKAVLQADKARREAIRNQFAPFAARSDLDQGALAALQRECEDDTDVTAEAAGQRLLDFLGKVNPATPTAGAMRAEAGDLQEGQTYRQGAIGALMHRINPSANGHDERTRQFLGFSLLDMARDCVERTGMRTRGMSRREIAVRALQSTSDFPVILENVVTKTLRDAYNETPRTFLPFCRRATLPDFKEVTRAQISGAPDLKEVLEGEEYGYAAMTDGGEKYRVRKYGRIVALTWEAIVNDDLSALTRIPTAFGASAAAKEADIVYGILTGNPKMSDNEDLFSAAHGNVGTPTALQAALDADAALDPIAEARQMMALQKGLEGRYITVTPQFLIVPPGLEKAALQLTTGNFVPAKTEDKNVFGPSLTAISEPRLHASSTIAYYLAAAPGLIDTIEYAYLEGNEGVFTESRWGFEVDGLEVKCRHVFGAAAIDHRGLFKNAGSAGS